MVAITIIEYVTLSFYANGFTVFIVVLIVFDCGFRL